MERDDLAKILPEDDVDFLLSRKYQFDIIIEPPNPGAADIVYVVFHEFQLPDSYEPRTVDLLIRISAGYPEKLLDMFFTNPIVRLKSSGGDPHQCSGRMTVQGKTWQQWSRHTPPDRWRPNIDCIETHLATVKRELEKRI